MAKAIWNGQVVAEKRLNPDAMRQFGTRRSAEQGPRS